MIFFGNNLKNIFLSQLYIVPLYNQINTNLKQHNIMAKPNMFTAAAEEATESTTKKTDKKSFPINDPVFEKNLQKFNKLKAEIDSLTTQLDLVKGDLIPVCEGIFFKEYEKMGSCPESFNLVSKSGLQTLFVVQKKYGKLDKELFTELLTKYGPEIAEKTFEYTIDKDCLEEHGEAVSDAIQNSKKIPEDVKKKLIKAKAVMVVNKDSIDKGLTFGKGLSGKVTLPEFFADIKPTRYPMAPKGTTITTK